MLEHDLTREGGRTYRYYTGKPLYRYGHGESYTEFTYAWSQPPPGSMSTQAAAAGFSLSVSVTNTGSTASDCVVLAFGSLTGADCPLRTLIGFERLSLVRPGATATATLAVDPRTLGCVDNAGVRTLPAGTLSLEAGDIVAPAKHSVTLIGPDLVMPV